MNESTVGTYSSTKQEPKQNQSRRAAASAAIGGMLEYYDFFIYATAASLVFPQYIFAPGNAASAISASLAVYGAGYVARPIGAFVLGHFGDTKGRKSVMLFCMLAMGLSTMGIGMLPTYQSAGALAPALLVILRLIQGFAVAGEISGSSSLTLEHAPFGRRGFFSSFTLMGVQGGQVLAAGVFLPLAAYMPSDSFNSWGWRIPFLLSFFVIVTAYVIRRKVKETPAFVDADQHGNLAKAPILDAVRTCWPSMIRVICVALANTVPLCATVFGAAYAVQAAYGIKFPKEMYLWIPVVSNLMALVVIPFVGNLTDKIGRRACIIIGALGSGALSFVYLNAIHTHNMPLALGSSIVMLGFFYQIYNGAITSYYPEQFPTRFRVSAVAVCHNIGTTATGFMPAVFAMLAPPGATNIPVLIGSITFGVTVIAAIAAFTSRETYRIALADLGKPDAQPVSKSDYDRMRQQAINEGAHARS